MSDYEDSRVVGVSANWLQFLWTNMGIIERYRQEGHYDYALGICADLVDWLPEDLKRQFKPRAETIRHNMEIITTAQLPALKLQTDVLARYAIRKRLLRRYAYAALLDFINKLSLALDEKNYYEFKKYESTGYGSSWKGQQINLKRQG